MGKYIKYKRFSKVVDESELEELLDEIVRTDFDVIYYHEDEEKFHSSKDSITKMKFKVTILAGKNRVAL